MNLIPYSRYARTVLDCEKIPFLREFLNEPDTPSWHSRAPRGLPPILLGTHINFMYAGIFQKPSMPTYNYREKGNQKTFHCDWNMVINLMVG